MLKKVLNLLFISSLIVTFSVGCSSNKDDVYNSEIENTSNTSQYDLTDNEKDLLFGHWKIKKLIGFTSVNDNESEIQNYPDGPKILNSDIFISNTNINYNIDIDTENPIPDDYSNESVDDYDVNVMYIGNSITADDFLQLQGTSGNFSMSEEDLPKEKVDYLFVNKKNEDYSAPVLAIFDNSKVVWYMYGAYFELEKVS